MASVITNVSAERTKLSTWHTIGATASGMAIGIIVVQTDAVKMGIYNCMSLFPVALTLLALIILWFFYPLGKKQVDENTRILAERCAAK